MSSMDGAGTPSDLPGLCEYAASVSAERLDRMLSHIDGVRKGEEAAPVHQMRVWSRRTRAALEIFHVCFDTKAFAELEREVKAATDALSEARDLDVMIADLTARGEKLPASQRTGIESFIERLRKKRETLQKSVAAAVTDLEIHDLARRFKELACKASEERAARLDAVNHSEPKARRNGKGRRRHG